MRSRLLARIAALVLVAGGLLMLPVGPAFADCGLDDHIHPDREAWGTGIFWQGAQEGGTPLRYGPHVGCDVKSVPSAGDGIDVHCAKNEPDSNNDWVYAHSPQYDNVKGWAREGQLRVDTGLLNPHTTTIVRCDGSGDVTIATPPA